MLRRQLQRISSTANKNQTKPTSINLKQLQTLFRAHFQQQIKNYEVPLLSTDGTLSYTSRFAKTVINQQLTTDDREGYFVKIKKSLSSQKAFTVQSSVDTCESLINFRFEGEENRIFEKLRAFAKQNEKRYTSKEADKFNRAHQFLMTERAEGPIKFKDFKLNSPKNQKEHLEESIRFELRNIPQLRIDWQGKKEVAFEIEIMGVKKIVKIFGMQENKGKEDEVQVQARRIMKVADKQKEIIIVNSQRQSHLVSKETLAQSLLLKPNYYQALPQIKHTSNNGYVSKLIANLLKINSKIKASASSNIDYLNHALQSNSIDELKEIFGYAKLNIFHIEYERLMFMINKARQSTAPQLQPFSYASLFEQEELEFYKILSLDEFNAKAVNELLRESTGKSVAVFCNEHKIPFLVRNMLKLCKQQNESWNRQNRVPQFLLHKLAICSLLYQIPLELPSLRPYITQYRKILHPLTHPYLFT